ncbi:unnamed protein product [Caenorhabditis angaria]|uniref:Protein kinase domain-containing protein n=1 Tax=Caenorhabditis angaria TaxID=860376 RepID=A0A9P1IIW5_9PELO|nr:unnamed protein product [Caenorhabditis angaria]
MNLLNEIRIGDPSFARNECEFLSKFLEESGETTCSQEELLEMTRNLVMNRICNKNFIDSRPAKKWIFLIFRTARVLFRDKSRVLIFHSLDVYENYVRMIHFMATRFIRNENEWNSVAVNCLNVTQKLVDNGENAKSFVEKNLEDAILLLLATRQMTILQHSLEILGRLSDWSDECRENLCETNTIDVCLQLIPDGDILTQKLCVSLLRILSCEEQAREQIRIYDGVQTLLGLLSIKNSRLQWHVAWTLAQLAEQVETSIEIAQLGGISLIFAEISNLKAPEKAVSDWIAMLTGLTALFAQLCQCTSNQQIITNSNGVYVLGKMLTIRKFIKNEEFSESWRLLQCSIFRILRLLFTYDRARQSIKKVFQTEIYEKFVDIGNYVHALGEYEEIADLYEKSLEENPEITKEWESVNERRQAMGEVGEFELLDQLGAGAFGCVYTVRKKALSHTDMPAKLFALKEIFMTHQGDRETDKSFGDMISEVKIIKQQMRHPNIVRYRKIFVDNHRLYIVMDLIQGCSLKEYIITTKDKKTNIEIVRIWNIIVQMMLALRYLHKEKHIVHRDLKPNNIMITDNYERVVITDFGLAKQKGPEYLKSAAGTIIYSCPEIVQNLPYGEKADIWSFGCCIYEMCQLTPAFHSNNMLTLAMQIVEAKYDPIDENVWSEDIRNLIKSCLTPEPSERPDILKLSEMTGSRILEYLDEVARQQATIGDKKVIDEVVPITTQSLNSSTSSYKRPSRTTALLPPINPERRNHSMSAGDTSRACSSSSVLSSFPRISNNSFTAQNRRRVQTCSTEHPIRSSSSTDLKPNLKISDSGLCVRSNALRPIQDPVLIILDQIHRILIVTDRDTNTNTTINHQRRLVEMFRKKILGKESSVEQMKMHLRKLAAESTDEVDINLGFSDFRPALLQAHLNGYQKDQKVTKITYEQLSACIQSLQTETAVFE